MHVTQRIGCTAYTTDDIDSTGAWRRRSFFLMDWQAIAALLCTSGFWRPVVTEIDGLQEWTAVQTVEYWTYAKT